jgi:ankyrin repeat protein
MTTTRFGMAAVVAAWVVAGVGVTSKDAPPRIVDIVKAGHLEGVRALIAQHVDVNVPEADGTTALHWAVRADDLSTASLLIRAGANVSVANRYGITPLALAAINGNAAIIETLLQAGANPNTTLREGETVLMRAARTGRADAVQTLLAHGADVNARESWQGQTALMWAAAANHADAVQTLIDWGADLDARANRLGDKPKQEGIDDRTQKDGAAVDAMSFTYSKGGLTPLLFASREGALGSARALLIGGADPNLADPDGITPLVLAIINGHYDTAALLIDAGVDLNTVDTDGRTALYAAVDMHTLGWTLNRPAPPLRDGRYDSLDIVRLLLDKGASANPRLARAVRPRKILVFGIDILTAGATPLLRAATQTDLPVLHALLEHGADPNLTTGHQATALMLAAGLGWKDVYSQGTDADAIEFMKVCLSRGADINATDENGQTALHGAAQRGSPSVIDFLISRGARLDVKNRQNRTPLDEALAYFPPREPAAVRLRELMTARGIPIEPPKRTGPRCCGGCDCTKDLKPPDQKDESNGATSKADKSAPPPSVAGERR